MSEAVGFIGLGTMGQGMVRNLLKEGFDVTVWNRTGRRTDPLLAEGAKGARTPADLAARCSIIIVSVSGTPEVEQVLLGNNGVINGAHGGSLVIDMSTISPQATREIAASLAERAIHMLDAPVSGSVEGADQGTLSIMVGGAADQFERARPYFEVLGTTITHVGGHGAGQTVKLVNQILVVINALAVGEALLFAQANGANLEKTLEAVQGGAAGSWMLTNRAPQILADDWRPGLTIDLQQNNLRLVLEAADQLGVPMLGTSLVFNLYRSLQAAGHGHEGSHALIKALEQLAGFKIGSNSKEAVF